MPMAMMLIYLVCFVIGTYCGVCIAAKRWHDRDKSAWMYLIILIPLLASSGSSSNAGVSTGRWPEQVRPIAQGYRGGANGILAWRFHFQA